MDDKTTNFNDFNSDFRWEEVDYHYPDNEVPGQEIESQEYYDFEENFFDNLDFSRDSLKDFDVKDYINADYLIPEVSRLYFMDYKFKNESELTEFKYANYILELVLMNSVNVYSIELYNDENSYINYQIQIPITLQVIKDNPTISEPDLIKMYLNQALKINVKEVRPINEIKNALGNMVCKLNVDRPEAWHILGECSNEKGMIDNKVNLNILDFIEKVSNMPDKETILDNGIERSINYSKVTTSNNIIDVKIPVKYSKNIDEVVKSVWDYEYLIPPVQNIDQDNQLKVNKDIISNQEVPEVTKRLGLFNGYSPSRYEILKMEYYTITTLHRPMINLIRENIEGLNMMEEEMDAFKIEQFARIQENSRDTHNVIDYSSSFSEIVSFPNIVRSTLNIKYEELREKYLDDIEDLVKKLRDMVKIEYNKMNNGEKYSNSSFDTLYRSYISVLSIYIYLIMKYKTSPEEIFLEYTRLSHIRECIRRKLFIANLSLVGNSDQMFKFTKGLPGSSMCGLLLYEFTFNNFNYKEIDDKEVYNDVKMEIKSKLGDTELDTFEKRLAKIEDNMAELF